jgi:hypothetical protein
MTTPTTPAHDPPEPSKEDLEKRKLRLEFNQLNKSWFRKPEWYPPLAAIIAILAAWGTF